MANKKNLSSQNGSETLAQKGHFNCKFNIKLTGLYVAYVFDHGEFSFRNVIVAQGLNATLREAALLIDKYTTTCGSLSETLARIDHDYEMGFITFREMDDMVRDLINPESWDEPIQMWTNKQAGISIGVAQVEEFISLLPTKEINKLMQDLTQELLDR